MDSRAIGGAAKPREQRGGRIVPLVIGGELAIVDSDVHASECTVVHPSIQANRLVFLGRNDAVNDAPMFASLHRAREWQSIPRSTGERLRTDAPQAR